MKQFLAVLIVLAVTPLAQAQQHVHNKTCLLGSCRPSSPIVSPIVAPVSRGVDLGRLEATTEAIKDEQRYQTHLMYLMLAQMQRSADLQLIGAVQAQNGATQIPRPDQVTPTPIPPPSQVTPTPIPPPSDVTPTRIPLPYEIVPTPVPGPRSGGTTQPFSPGGTPPTSIAPPIPTRHVSWPQVTRK